MLLYIVLVGSFFSVFFCFMLLCAARLGGDALAPGIRMDCISKTIGVAGIGPLDAYDARWLVLSFDQANNVGLGFFALSSPMDTLTNEILVHGRRDAASVAIDLRNIPEVFPH